MTSDLMVPSGMLRISRQGEVDRVIYPVHADGWRQQGWTVHPPVLDSEDEQEPPQPLAMDGTLLSQDGADLGGEGEAEPPFPEPIDLERLTKAQIEQVMLDRYGVNLDTSHTRAQLIAAAQAVISAAPAAEADPQEEPEARDGEVGAVVPQLLI